MIPKPTNNIEAIDLIHTDSEIKLFKTLIQIILYILELLLEIDETHDFFEESEVISLTNLQDMLEKKILGKSNMLKILASKPQVAPLSDSKLNTAQNFENNLNRRKHNYELNL